MLFSCLKVISGLPVICAIGSVGLVKGMIASVMSCWRPGEGVSSPQRLLQLPGQVDSIKTQWMTLSFYWSLMLRDFVVRILLGKQR